MNGEIPTLPEPAPARFLTSSVGPFTHEVPRLVKFYEGLGFRETYRNTRDGTPDHVELKLDGLTLAVSSVKAAISVHGPPPDLGGRLAYVFIWTSDTDAAYRAPVGAGAPSVRPPQDFRADLRTAWIVDPDGNFVNRVYRRA